VKRDGTPGPGNHLLRRDEQAFRLIECEKQG
jgi:hypothetical protein